MGGLTIGILNYDSETFGSHRKRHQCRHLFSQRHELARLASFPEKIPRDDLVRAFTLTGADWDLVVIRRGAGKRETNTDEASYAPGGNGGVHTARYRSIRRNREELSPPAASRRRRWVAICLVGHERFAVSEPLYLQRVRCAVEQVP